MNNTTFIKNEEFSNSSHIIRLNWRLFRSLPLFLKLFPITMLLILLASGAPSVFRWYAGKYALHHHGAESIDQVKEIYGSDFHLEGLIWIVVLATLFRILAWISFEVSGMWESQRIYSSIVQSLSKTRTTFFDENPSGRIMNRLIRDYEEVRSTAIIFVGDIFNATVEVLSIGAVACFATPWAILAVIPLLLIFLFIHSQRSSMIGHCRSLSTIAASHVLNRKNDLVDGGRIFILYGKSEHLLTRMMDSLRNYLKSSALTIQVDTWASFWIRCFAEGFSLVVLLCTIEALQVHRIDVTIAGVIISALFGITGSMGWLDFAAGMVSRSVPHLRRVFEFADLPQEQKEEFSGNLGVNRILDTAPALSLHHDNDIVFQNYSMSYRKDLPLIIQDLNLVICAGSKTAWIGRTGSGKSSIFQALLRMVYVVEGDIRIGVRSIFEDDIRTHRQRFGVVPQIPYLFEGTLRTNLDRAGNLEESQLKNALAQVGLIHPLDFQVEEGGHNFSVGERQLVCLARVIASNRSIILMDEPTSGLDPETDARITWLLNNALKNKTILTIAHRKESIRNYDTVIEMNAGKVVGTARK